jgi:alcohol dehydrogenase (cytochrome c)/quinohemoprotein ethanol dehydrogenase
MNEIFFKRTDMKKLAISVLAGLVLAACDNAPAAPSEVTTENAAPTNSLVREMANPGVWLSHGRTYDEQRHSPLSQITPENVSELGLSWYYDMDTRRGQEATPLYVDGVLYLTSAWSKVHAFDARTGELIWQYDPEVPGPWAVRGCCDVVNRGVAYRDGVIFSASFDGRLFALDAKTGVVKWETDTITDRSKNYTVTGAPRVVKGRVLIGNGGGEFGVRGYVSAYDVQTGELDWRFYTVPGNPADGFESAALEMAAETWSGEWWIAGGGGTVWDSMAYDAELDLLYIGVGNGSPWNPDVRAPGNAGIQDNLFLSSIVALRPDTGEYVWHYQTTPGDQWDFTATQQMILADLEIDGAMRKVLMQAPKNGFFYVIDRETGEFISGEAFVPVNWATGLDPETGRPNIVPEAYYQQRDGTPFEATPGPMGAHNWHSMSFDPETGLVYLPAQVLGFPYFDVPDDYELNELSVNLGVDLKKVALPGDPEIRKQIRRTIGGHLLAWDPVAQKEVWRVEHGGAWNGGTLATAGGVIFQGNHKGDFAAYDSRTGETLWSEEVQTGVVAAPISYEMDGEQYVAILAGWGGILPLLVGDLSHIQDEGPQVNRSRLLVYKLGGELELPEPYDVTRARVPAPPSFGTPDQIDIGLGRYQRYCAGCHGDTAVSGGVLPDLRWSYALTDEDTWMLITRDGGLEQAGMVGFGSELSDEDLTAIRAYITHRAHESGVASPTEQE